MGWPFSPHTLPTHPTPVSGSASSGSGGKGRDNGRPVTVAALAMERAKGGDELLVGSESGHLYLAPALHKQAAKLRGGAAGLGAGVGVGVAAVQPVRFGGCPGQARPGLLCLALPFRLGFPQPPTFFVHVRCMPPHPYYSWARTTAW